MSNTTRFMLACVVALMLSARAGAQQQWTLAQCIEYAQSHNLQIKRQSNVSAQAEIQLRNARTARLPSLSASASQNFSFGRSIGANNTYVNEGVNTTSFGLSTDIPLLTGYRIPNTVKQSMLTLQATQSDIEYAKNNLKVSVTEAYAQILYAKETLNIAHRQVEIDSLQTVRLQLMLDNGRATEVEVYQQKASLAQSRQTRNSATISLKNAKLKLVQLMELDTLDGFDVSNPNTDVSDLMIGQYAEVSDYALQTRPEITAEALRLQAAEKNVGIAKSQYYPTLSLSGGLSTNYYNSTSFDSDPFMDQLKNRFSEYIALHLSVPIFNRFQVRNRVRSARIDVENQGIALASVKRDVQQQIYTAYNRALDAQSNYMATLETTQSSQKAFEMVTVMYENGRSTIYEFNESKRQYIDNQCRLLQAKYDYLFAVKLLAFYGGKEITL